MDARTAPPGGLPPRPQGAVADASGLDVFVRERPALFRLAHRLLDGGAEVEDVLQDAFLRWHRLGVGRREILQPGAYLTRVVRRLCLDVLRSAWRVRVRHEGTRPALVHGAGGTPHLVVDPSQRMDTADDLSTALTVILKRLNPVERAVLLLRESFEFSYAEVAVVVGKTEANCRQIDRRARQRLREPEPRSGQVRDEDRESLRRLFVAAAYHGGLSALVTFLSEQVASWTGGPGSTDGEAVPAEGSPLRRTA